MKVNIEYNLDDTHSVQYAEYNLHRKFPEILDFFFTFCNALFESDSSLEDRLEICLDSFEKLKIYNDLMAYKLALNQQLKDKNK